MNNMNIFRSKDAYELSVIDLSLLSPSMPKLHFNKQEHNKYIGSSNGRIRHLFATSLFQGREIADESTTRC